MPNHFISSVNLLLTVNFILCNSFPKLVVKTDHFHSPLPPPLVGPLNCSIAVIHTVHNHNTPHLSCLVYYLDYSWLDDGAIMMTLSYAAFEIFVLDFTGTFNGSCCVWMWWLAASVAFWATTSRLALGLAMVEYGLPLLMSRRKRHFCK